MSYRTAVELEVITMDDDRTVNRVGKPPDTTPSTDPKTQTVDILNLFPRSKGADGRYTKEEFKEMFPDLFSGKLGCLKNVRVPHDMAKPILLKTFYFRQFPYFQKKFESCKVP